MVVALSIMMHTIFMLVYSLIGIGVADLINDFSVTSLGIWLGINDSWL